MASYAPHRTIPAPIHRGMQKLDKSKFTTTIQCLAAKVGAEDVKGLTSDKIIRTQMLNIPRVKHIARDPDSSSDKLLLFDVTDESQLSSEVSEILKRKTNGLNPFEVEIDYDYWQAGDIIQAVLPEDLLDEAPQSFTTTGHIGHVNLKDEYLPYKHLIGQVLLDKNKNLRTIVNKLDSIDTEFRVFKMEVLAGDEDFVAVAKESACSFTFDFRHVYWNSRLSYEHERLVALFNPGELVADVMAGVGPFAVPAAKKGVRVLGNDLNPESVKWMEVNRKDNKVQDSLRITNLDGRAFIHHAPLEAWRNPFSPLPISPSAVRKLEKEKRRARDAIKAAKESEDPEKALAALKLQEIDSAKDKKDLDPVTTLEKPAPQTISHFVMNLPGSALEFLDAYRGSYKSLLNEPNFGEKELDEIKMGLVHTHCFTRELETDLAEADICERASHYLGHPVTPQMDGYHLHMVRSVAPNKHMYCITFRLPKEVAFK